MTHRWSRVSLVTVWSLRADRSSWSNITILSLGSIKTLLAL